MYLHSVFWVLPQGLCVYVCVCIYVYWMCIRILCSDINTAEILMCFKMWKILQIDIQQDWGDDSVLAWRKNGGRT